MKAKIDLHTHTISSGHAYSTLIENAKEASKKGIEVLGVTDHGPCMPGGPHLYHFGNKRAVPSIIEGVTILFGAEANILDYDGNLDMPDFYLKKLDIILASLHEPVIKPGTMEENTNAILKVMDNPYVDILAHLGNPVFELDYEKIIKKAKEKSIFIEINNSSNRSRKGSFDNCVKIAQLCKELKVPVVLGTDSHIAYQIGEFTEALKVTEAANLSEDLIINYDKALILNYLKKKGKIKDINLD
ncbi:MAG: phosphatase [Clostridiaceae bacterium]